METQYGVDFESLVTEVGEWSRENFGDQPARYPLLGIGEEIGELATSVLKRAQGIDTADKYTDPTEVGAVAEKDAVGDITIYLADFTSRVDGEMQGVNEANLDTDDTDIDAVRAMSALFTEYSYLSSFHYSGVVEDGMVKMYPNGILMALSRFCDTRGYSYPNCVGEAWNDEVIDRSWNADPVETVEDQ